MDRFIVVDIFIKKDFRMNLKSNMDRFIVKPVIISLISLIAFKIQYG